MLASLCIFLESNLTAHWRCIDLWSRDVHWILGDGQHAGCSSNRDLIILVVQRSVQFPGICWIFEQYLNDVCFSNFPPPPLVTVPLTQLISTNVSIFEGTLSLPSPSQGIKVWNMTPRKRSNIVGRAGYPMKQMAPPWLSKFVKK